ncbi:MAG: SdrD B-like domain-containing protein, partial [Anaerolineae bacterium]|nr:SdrD B-like domain-containing protein [Anaerolineae bacterium]
GSVRGLVWHDVNRNGVPDPNEIGLANVTITASRNGTPVAQTRSKADGTYRMDNLPAGLMYTISHGGAHFYRQTTPAQRTVVVPAGITVSDIDFGLYYAPPPLYLPLIWQGD